MHAKYAVTLGNHIVNFSTARIRGLPAITAKYRHVIYRDLRSLCHLHIEKRVASIISHV